MVAQVLTAAPAGVDVGAGKKLRLGTRKSVLALAQSNWVKEEIETHWPDFNVYLVKFTTKGDRILDVPLAKVGGKGLFVKEIEDALLRKDADFAVHSLKDVPAELPEGLEVTIFPDREDPRDALISRAGLRLEELPEGARVGTSSLRRIAQLRNARPDLEVAPLRGNIDTRLRKLDEGQYDAIILAAAGLIRLGLEQRIIQLLEPEVMLPAVGQGALGIEFRSIDTEVKRILASIHHEETSICVRAERAFLFRLEGGCQVPIGAFAQLKEETLELEGMVGNETGTDIIRMKRQGSADQPEALGTILGEEILAAGGAEILREVYGTN
ncbi:MAG: hydroxymethylbilane synthase [Deltaproteobacteria bacterium]|nr:MAG: hydroxymethylbilane synthase [Deltaproteobacteria bacterium]